MEDLFEPQLVDLVNDDEQELVVLRRTGTLAVVLLQREQLVELQEAGIGYGHVLLALSGRGLKHIGDRGVWRLLTPLGAERPMTGRHLPAYG